MKRDLKSVKNVGMTLGLAAMLALAGWAAAGSGSAGARAAPGTVVADDGVCGRWIKPPGAAEPICEYWIKPPGEIVGDGGSDVWIKPPGEIVGDGGSDVWIKP